MNMTRRAFAVLGSSAVSSAFAAPAQTQPQPQPTLREKKLTILVAQPPGGISDSLARAIAPTLSEGLGRTAVIENVAGASGSLAASRLLAEEPDGDTVLVGSPSETILAPLTLRSVQYRATDFRLLGLITNSPLAMYARGDLPASNLDELVALGRQTGGKTLSYGTTGFGSLFHLQTERLLATAGMKAVHVPYRGGMPMLLDLQSGIVDFAMLPVDTLLERKVASGKIKVLGIASPRKLARFPEAALFDESKSAPRFGHPTIWVGLLIPAALNAGASAHLHKAAMDTLGDEEVREAIERIGGKIPPPMSMADAARFYAADAAKLQALVKAAQIQEG